MSIELELFVPLKLLYLLNLGIPNSSSFLWWFHLTPNELTVERQITP